MEYAWKMIPRAETTQGAQPSEICAKAVVTVLFAANNMSTVKLGNFISFFF